MPRARAPRRSATSRASSAPSVLLLSAAMGAGHDGVAYELQRRLRERGATAEVHDYLELLPLGAGPFYRAVYQGQLKYAPGSYEWLYGRIDRGLLAPVARWLGQLGRRRVRKLARQHDVVVSTYPLGCQATGALRRKGQLDVPAVGFLTDVDVHGLWLHEGVDLNLTVWEGSAQEATARSGVPSRAVGPVLPDTFLAPSTPEERSEGRALLGVGADETVVLVVAGSWGVGDVGTTARALRDAGVGTPVVLCGRNDALVAELDREPGVVALGWTTEVRRLLAAADVLVHNAGGLTCLEGFAVGVPVVGYACLPGHGHRNSRAMADAGVAAHADTVEELLAAVRRLARTGEGAAMAARARELFALDPTDLVLDLARAPRPETVPVRPVRTWAARAAAVAVAVPATLGASSFGVAHAGGVGTAEGRDAVYVAALVDHAQASSPAVAAVLRRSRVSAAVGTGVTPTDVRALSGAGVTVVGTDHGVRSRDPRRLRAAVDAAAALDAAAGEAHPKVLCVRAPGMVERVVAWDHDVQLALTREVLLPGAVPARLQPGRLVLLDERGRSTAEVAADLDALAARVAQAHLPRRPLRALWPA